MTSPNPASPQSHASPIQSDANTDQPNEARESRPLPNDSPAASQEAMAYSDTDELSSPQSASDAESYLSDLVYPDSDPQTDSSAPETQHHPETTPARRPQNVADCDSDASDHSIAEVTEWTDAVFAEYAHGATELNQAAPDSGMHLFPATDRPPVYLDEGSIPGTYLMNSTLGVMRRSRGVRQSNIQYNRLLAHFVSVTGHPTTSMIYPESILFPSIFWATRDSSVIGSIPNHLYSLSDQLVHREGFLTVSEHARIRMKSSHLQTAQQKNYVLWTGDLQISKGLSHSPASLVMNKGLHALQEAPSHATEAYRPDSEDMTLRGKELESMFKHFGGSDYFVTVTVSEGDTPGIGQIIRAMLAKVEGDTEKLSTLYDQFYILLCRIWEKTGRNIMEYITKSPEHPFGHVQYYWWRWEFVISPGGALLPHIHALLWLHPEEESVTASRICRSHKAMFTEDYGASEAELKEKGIVESSEEFVELWGSKVECLYHNCAKIQNRCHTKVERKTGELKCKFATQRKRYNQKFIELNVYDQETQELFIRLGVGRRQNTPGLGEQFLVDSSLRAGVWEYPCDDGTMSSHFPLLFAITKSATNSQKGSHRFGTAYLIDYTSGKQKHQEMQLKGTETPGVISSSILGPGSGKGKEKTGKKSPDAMLLSYGEQIWYAMDFPMVHCNVDFVHINTKPPEYRAGFTKGNRTDDYLVDYENNRLIPVHCRRHLEDWRQFTEGQQLHMWEFVDSTFYLDKVGYFNVRCPELLIFNTLDIFWKCFVTSPSPGYAIGDTLQTTPWIDGVVRRTLLRKGSLDAAIDFLEQKEILGDQAEQDHAEELLDTIFRPIKAALEEGNEGDPIVQRFVDLEKTNDTLTCMSTVKPSQAEKFIVHCLLTMGQFNCETEMYTAGNVMDMLIHARILPHRPNDNDEISDFQNRLSRRYLLEDLRHVAMITRQLKRNIYMADEIFRSIVQEDQLAFMPAPSIRQQWFEVQATEQVSDLKGCLL